MIISYKQNFSHSKTLPRGEIELDLVDSLNVANALGDISRS